MAHLSWPSDGINVVNCPRQIARSPGCTHVGSTAPARPTRSWLTLIAFALAAALLLAPAASAAPFSRIISFGDSYTDSGNWIRVTNGPVWVEYLGEMLGMPGAGSPSDEGGDNYAVSAAKATGAISLDLEGQLDRYFADNPTGDPEALYLLFIGFNDIEPGSDRSAATADAITSAVDRLVEQGAEQVLVLEISNKARTPRYLQADSALRRQLTRDVWSVNWRIRMDELSRRAWIGVVDMYALTSEVYADPAAFGFVDASTHCSYDPVCDGFVWWDDIHPTTAFHRVIARRVVARLVGRCEAEVDAMTPGEIEFVLASKGASSRWRGRRDRRRHLHGRYGLGACDEGASRGRGWAGGRLDRSGRRAVERWRFWD